MREGGCFLRRCPACPPAMLSADSPRRSLLKATSFLISSTAGPRPQVFFVASPLGAPFRCLRLTRRVRRSWCPGSDRYGPAAHARFFRKRPTPAEGGSPFPSVEKPFFFFFFSYKLAASSSLLTRSVLFFFRHHGSPSSFFVPEPFFSRDGFLSVPCFQHAVSLFVHTFLAVPDFYVVSPFC